MPEIVHNLVGPGAVFRLALILARVKIVDFVHREAHSIVAECVEKGIHDLLVELPNNVGLWRALDLAL